MSVLTVEHLSHQFLDKQLYDDTGFQVNPHDHLGIIGQNGVGKSTLINIITGNLIPDEGSVTWQKHTHVGYLDQYANLTPGLSIFDFLKTAFSDLYEKEAQMTKDYNDYAENPDDELLTHAGQLQADLEAHDFYNLETKIEQVASGLGIDAIGLDRDVSQLSGGQRSKIILAKLLLEQPDMLLLDEPTNYLDVNHIEWLSGYLNDFEGAFIVISHDYKFLEKITNCIVDIQFGQITKYTGTLQQALKQKAADHETYLKAYEKQQTQIQKTKAYIRKFKAGSRSKSAKSREKQLAHMDVLTSPGNLRQAHFDFPYESIGSQVLMTVNQLLIGYDGEPLLKQPVNFSISQTEKMVLTGFNGIGKSTLIKTLLGQIPAISGDFELAPNLKVGYFRQELYWPNPKQTPLEFMQNQFPEIRPKELRQVLARTGITADDIAKPLTMLSGGEQTKVKLAELMLKPANLLILDEPTNHLDDQTKQALSRSLASYPGAILLVTHEADFYAGDWVDDILDVETLQ